MALIGRPRKQAEPEPEEIEEKPSAVVEPEKKHPGDIEPILDVIGWRVYQSDKAEDAIELPREQYAQAKILSKLILLEKLATE